MRQTTYSIFILVQGEWTCAKDGRMSKEAAEGLFAQFAQQYQTRLFRGADKGLLVKSNVTCNAMGRPDF